MADKTTFIKLDRNITHWRWFKNSKVLHVFLWLLLRANVKEGHFEKDTISRGSLATSNASIAESCGLTVDNVRTALSNLEETGEISRITRNRYQIITIVNYEEYQSDIRKLGGQIPSNPDVKSQPTAMSNPNNQRKKEEKKEIKKEEDGFCLKDPQTGRVYKRGTDEFRNMSHLLLKRDEGIPDDIPYVYRDMFKEFPPYHDWRNQ